MSLWNKIIISCFLLLVIGCQDSQLSKKVMSQPYWSLSEVVANGETKKLSSGSTFTLYKGGKIGGSFPINGFGGKALFSDDGTVTFSEVMWTSMAGGEQEYQDELFIQKTLLASTKATLENDILTLSDGKNSLKYIPCDFPYITSLKEKKWQLLGMQQHEDEFSVVAYRDPKEQYKGLKSISELTITLKCKADYKYDESSNSIVYELYGEVGENSYTARLSISKDRGKKKVDNFVMEGKDSSEFSEQLKNLRNWSYMHNNLHVDTAGRNILVFSVMD